MDKIFIVEKENRLDKFLCEHINTSRNQLEQLIKKGFVKVDDKNILKTGFKLKVSSKIEVNFPKNEINPIKDETFIKKSLEGKDIEVIYEDKAILVINKPYNLTVHEAPSVKS